MENKRLACLQNILQSDSPKKIIVAGPGTGKTYTFQQIIEADPTNNLVITFINNLVNDMRESLGHLAEVRTFHSLSLKELHSKPYYGITADFHFYTSLADIIGTDSSILSSSGSIETNYECRQLIEAFRLLIDSDNRIDFFLSRANFYNAVGFDDSVFRVLKRFENRPETIPIYNNVLVDEYQDFNPLEVEFINFLETDSQILIVGDDDQAIYQFRGASPFYLREKAKNPNYQFFPLPYCSRCTEIIIQSVNSIVKNAQDIGLLQERVQKEFICYTPDKSQDNETYPYIKKVTCSVNTKTSPYIAKYIETAISDISDEEIQQSINESYPIALIVGPSHYLNQIYEYLKGRLPNIEYEPRKEYDVNLLDGYKLLMENDKSNLGWRIIIEFLLPEELNRIVLETYNTSSPIYDLLDRQFTEHHLSILSLLFIALEKPDELTNENKEILESLLGMPYANLVEKLGQINNNEDEENQEQTESENGSPIIKMTTYSGCKGLSSGFTFVTGLEEGIFPKQNNSPSPSEICHFIVDITRTRKECHLIHTKMFAGNWTERSVFFDWIPEDFCQTIDVSKTYF